MSEEEETRSSRQASLLPPDRLSQILATVIGVGAIGRQVALQLAAAGQRRIQLFDHDRVEVVNLGPQGYYESDVGDLKVDAVGRVMQQMQTEVVLELCPRRIGRSERLGSVIFVCVDSIDTRRRIWEEYGEEATLFIDGRMAAETIRVVTSCDRESAAYYPSTLFAGNEAFQGACTAKSTIFTANIAAGIMMEQYSKWLRGHPLDRDILINLLAMEMSAKL